MLEPLQWVDLFGVAGAPTVATTYVPDIVLRSTDLAPWSAIVNGSPVPIQSVAPEGSDGVELTLPAALQSGDTVEVTYAPPPYTVSSTATGALAGPQTDSVTIT